MKMKMKMWDIALCKSGRMESRNCILKIAWNTVILASEHRMRQNAIVIGVINARKRWSHLRLLFLYILPNWKFYSVMPAPFIFRVWRPFYENWEKVRKQKKKNIFHSIKCNNCIFAGKNRATERQVKRKLIHGMHKRCRSRIVQNRRSFVTFELSSISFKTWWNEFSNR